MKTTKIGVVTHRRYTVRCSAAALFLLVLILLPAPAWAGPQNPCREGNLLSNCTFDDFTGSPPRQVPNGWTPFISSGDLEYRQVLGDECHSVDQPSCLIMRSNGLVFTAGLWRQVGGLQPGATYRAGIGWGAPAAPTDSFGRQLGIDPTGGTDPGSPNVVWGPKHFGDGRVLSYDGPYSAVDPSIDVSAVAKGDTVTVFVLVDHTYTSGDNFIYLDMVGLRQDTSQPVVAPPTATPVPATATSDTRPATGAASRAGRHFHPNDATYRAAHANTDVYGDPHQHGHADGDAHPNAFSDGNPVPDAELLRRCRPWSSGPRRRRCRSTGRQSRQAGVNRRCCWPAALAR